MINRWKQAQNAASDAIIKTLENGFDVLKTAKDLHEKYADEHNRSKISEVKRK